MSLAATVAWIVPGVGVRRVPVVVGFVMGVVVPVRATAAEMRVGRVALGTAEDRAVGNVVIVPGDGIRRVPVVVGIVMGVESGSPKLRKKVLERHMSNQAIIDAFDLCHEYGLHTSAFLMFGMPYEDRLMME